MRWVEDCDTNMVNIANWDVIEIKNVEDHEKGCRAAVKIVLTRKEEEYILGYMNAEEDSENILEQLTQGVKISMRDLEDVLYYYLEDEFEERFGDLSCDEFEKGYEKRMKMIEKLIGKRFFY